MTEPHAPLIPTTANVGSNVRIRWYAPYSGAMGVDITGYYVLIKKKDGTFTFNNNCNGLQQVVASNLFKSTI
jgi:hypothetical protein